MHVNRVRPGFTLVELLVVIAIIGILVSLVFPAIQVVRNAARSTACLNNIRQVSLGVQGFEAAFQRLPTAGAQWHWIDITAADHPDSYNNPLGGSILTSILPYLGQDRLFERLQEELEPGDRLGARLEELSNTPIPLFFCPAASEQDQKSNTSINAGSISYRGEFTSHYYGVAGPIGQGKSSASPPEIYPSPTDSYKELKYDGSGEVDFLSGTVIPDGGQVSMEGVFAPNLTGTFAGKLAIDSEDIRDGTSNTLALGEISGRRISLTGDDPKHVGWAFGVVFDGDIENPVLDTTFSSKSLRFRINRKSSETSPTPVNANSNNMPFTSNHAGGAQFALADGSARFISEAVDEDILKTWMSINVREDSLERDLDGQ